MAYKLSLGEPSSAYEGREMSDGDPYAYSVVGFPFGFGARISKLEGVWKVMRILGKKQDEWRGSYGSPEEALKSLQDEIDTQGLPPPETLPVFCYRCGKPVLLTLAQWPVTVHGEMVTKGHIDIVQVWTCPHCEEPNEGKFPSMVIEAEAGHEMGRL